VRELYAGALFYPVERTADPFRGNHHIPPADRR
jgi:hypothetical protein